jgi:hypothetical protein
VVILLLFLPDLSEVGFGGLTLRRLVESESKKVRDEVAWLGQLVQVRSEATASPVAIASTESGVDRALDQLQDLLGVEHTEPLAWRAYVPVGIQTRFVTALVTAEGIVHDVRSMYEAARALVDGAQSSAQLSESLSELGRSEITIAGTPTTMLTLMDQYRAVTPPVRRLEELMPACAVLRAQLVRSGSGRMSTSLRPALERASLDLEDGVRDVREALHGGDISPAA